VEPSVASVLCVPYDDPVDGHPPAHARDDVPGHRELLRRPDDADAWKRRLHAGRVARQRLGVLPAPVLRGSRHRFVVASDKDGPDSEFERELPDADLVISQPFWPAYLTAAGAGAHSYSEGDATRGSVEAARFTT
jgi:formate dehydrogenase